ncbi:MAG: D-alanine--D-alanine ligase [Actinomycetota bacterium]|nr:D-alanine--D-alanine ligase [Actinomycetota bacterium]
MPVTDKKIGVLMGGASAERDVSLKTGDAIYKALSAKGYSTVKIDAGTGKNLTADLAGAGVEIAFIALHGGMGENGAVQGLLEVLGMPYTGSGVLASALAMDKEFSKKAFLYHKLPVPEFIVLEKETGFKKPVFGPPWVVKPVAEGSSIGVEMANNEEELGLALERSFKLGGKVIVEKRIYGKEIQVGILAGKVLGAVEVRPSLDFYSYEAKYTAGKTEYILPPEMPEADLKKAYEAGLAAHKALGCGGATRVDLIVADAIPYVLEVNTIPGMTETSLLPKIARLSGLDFGGLVEAIVEDAIQKEGK